MTIVNSSDADCIPGVTREIYSDADFRRIARLAHSRAGIVLGDHKMMLAYSRLAPLVRRSGLITFSAFLDHAEQDDELSNQIIAVLTTNHTYFNREAHHFEHFTQYVRPALIERLKARQRVRLWSAASSSGEEAWTLLMYLLGSDRAAGKQIATSDIRLLGTDLAPHAIERANAAEYETKALSAIPDELRVCWTGANGPRSRIAPEVRKLAHFKRLNLLGDWPMRQPFDVIFCRNVMIYFDQPTKERLIHRLAQQLCVGGYLYIGHSERATGAGLDLLEAVGPTVYQRCAS